MKRLVMATLAASLVACEGVPVRMGSEGPPPAGNARELTARACGYQLLFLIPIAINGRQYNAYRKIVAQAGRDYITDVRVTEEWYWGFAGTVYCTNIDAKAIGRT